MLCIVASSAVVKCVEGKSSQGSYPESSCSLIYTIFGIIRVEISFECGNIILIRGSLWYSFYYHYYYYHCP